MKDRRKDRTDRNTRKKV